MLTMRTGDRIERDVLFRRNRNDRNPDDTGVDDGSKTGQLEMVWWKSQQTMNRFLHMGTSLANVQARKQRTCRLWRSRID